MFRWRLVQEGGQRAGLPPRTLVTRERRGLSVRVWVPGGAPQFPQLPHLPRRRSPVWGRPHPPVGYSKLMQASLSVCGPPTFQNLVHYRKTRTERSKKAKNEKIVPPAVT